MTACPLRSDAMAYRLLANVMMQKPRGISRTLIPCARSCSFSSFSLFSPEIGIPANPSAWLESGESERCALGEGLRRDVVLSWRRVPKKLSLCWNHDSLQRTKDGGCNSVSLIARWMLKGCAHAQEDANTLLPVQDVSNALRPCASAGAPSHGLKSHVVSGHPKSVIVSSPRECRRHMVRLRVQGRQRRRRGVPV